jgi:hypothetical protein
MLHVFLFNFQKFAIRIHFFKDIFTIFLDQETKKNKILLQSKATFYF